MNEAPVNRTALRLTSLDAYRGFVMLLILGEMLNIDRIARAFPASAFWQFLAHETDHVHWVGCSLHDLIQPSFSFLVGVALPFSIANRIAKGQSRWQITRHAAWRSFLLIFLGIFLRSGGGRSQLNFTFEDTLTQIGLGYSFLFFIGFRTVKFQWCALGTILFIYWLAWALYPLPGPDFDYASAATSADWPHNLSGFAAHWNKNTNLGAAFDRWFMNLFARPQPFTANRGGYLTLSFIPTLGTMILGLIAGGWLRAGLPDRKLLQRFLIAGVLGLVAGGLLHFAGICPLVKRIWTPSWTLFSGGWCFLLLAAFYAAVDVWDFKKLAFPLTVVGMNSIAAYCFDHWIHGFVANSLKACLGARWPLILGSSLEPLVSGAGMILGFWLILYWMYRQKIFIRI